MDPTREEVARILAELWPYSDEGWVDVAVDKIAAFLADRPDPEVERLRAIEQAANAYVDATWSGAPMWLERHQAARAELFLALAPKSTPNPTPNLGEGRCETCDGTGKVQWFYDDGAPYMTVDCYACEAAAGATEGEPA